MCPSEVDRANDVRGHNSRTNWFESGVRRVWVGTGRAFRRRAGPEDFLSPIRAPIRCSGMTQPIYSQPMSNHSTASGALRAAPSSGARLLTADGRALPLEWVDLESEAGGGVAG